MGCLPRGTCLGLLSLTQSPNLLVLGEGLEIWDNHLWYVLSKVVFQSMTIYLEIWLDSAIREHLGDSERSRPAGLKLAREKFQSRIKEEDSITDVKNAIFDLGVMEPLSFLFVDQRSEGQSLHALRPSRLCAQARSIDAMPFPYTSLYGVNTMGVLKAVRKAQRASSSLSDLEAWFSPTVLSKILFKPRTTPMAKSLASHISSKEFVLLLGRHSLNNEIPRMVVCKIKKPEEEHPSKQSRLGIFLSKEIFEGGVIRIHNAFVHDDTGHRPGYLRKVLYESSIETGMTEKATDTLDGGGIR
nr:hypothetical protein [Tanacetum cinerariifolium]